MDPNAKDASPGANASTRVEILKSAALAFRQLGYHGATVEQIAATLEMKKGNLYYYFKSKEEILFACHEYSHDRLQELLDQTVRSTASAEAKLRKLIGAAVHAVGAARHELLDRQIVEPHAPDHALFQVRREVIRFSDQH